MSRKRNRLNPTERARKFLEQQHKSKLKVKRIKVGPKTWIEVDENDPRYYFKPEFISVDNFELWCKVNERELSIYFIEKGMTKLKDFDRLKEEKKLFNLFTK